MQPALGRGTVALGLPDEKQPDTVSEWWWGGGGFRENRVREEGKGSQRERGQDLDHRRIGLEVWNPNKSDSSV